MAGKKKNPEHNPYRGMGTLNVITVRFNTPVAKNRITRAADIAEMPLQVFCRKAIEDAATARIAQGVSA